MSTQTETQYSLSYYEGEEIENKMPWDSYDTIQDCIDWADNNNVPVSVLHITEWEGDEITGQVCLEACVIDGQRDNLSLYYI